MMPPILGNADPKHAGSQAGSMSIAHSSTPPRQFDLELTPSRRLDLIDLSQECRTQTGGILDAYATALYCSYHTTAGFLDSSLCARLRHSREAVRSFLRPFQRLFPQGACYRHDELHLREELSSEQREVEPKNADSHLTFISSGLRNCVTYANAPDTPVFLIDLDGTNGDVHRRRKTSVIAYNRERVRKRVALSVPVSNHPIDSVNLGDPRLGFFEELDAQLRQLDIQKGRIDITLDRREQRAGITVNEYETLLMRHDLAEVLQNPLRFMAERGRHLIEDPGSVRNKVLNYAKYDLVQLVNEAFDALGMSESLVERAVDRFLALPASRALRMKRSITLAVSDVGSDRDRGRIVQGTYQSPILVQWERAVPLSRRLNASFVAFE